jgi:Cys-rich protein (TIGR01571 family)
MPYNTGLCNFCSDTGICMDVICCTTCHLSRVINALNFMPNQCSCCPVLLPCCFLCDVCKSQTLMEQRFAPETGLNSGCFCSTFCPWCVICQTSRELHMRTMNPGSSCCSSGITASLPPALSPQQMGQMMQWQQQNQLQPRQQA